MAEISRLNNDPDSVYKYSAKPIINSNKPSNKHKILIVQKTSVESTKWVKLVKYIEISPSEVPKCEKYKNKRYELLQTIKRPKNLLCRNIHPDALIVQKVSTLWNWAVKQHFWTTIHLNSPCWIVTQQDIYITLILDIQMEFLIKWTQALILKL